MPPATQIHGFFSSRRWGLRTRAATTAAPKSSVECLFSSPSPARTPNHTQSRESPVRTMRMRKKTHPIQKRASKPFIVRMLSMPR